MHSEIATHMKAFGMQHHVSDKFISIIHRENEGSMNAAQRRPDNHPQLDRARGAE
jgi:hypothetical protein